ncbi:amidohydrolase [Winogradskyella immobilis]|uniref:Amidohydrolase n=1 Tax=Winogradskyella immobilis TaxID=2816852 RepID=A0ABS8EQ85_9FLAO|nr:amidohydrolase [Winogradskyella immobilis]MCC1485371.1 amidohydrolase [Winogradskyella immobilis]MCG0017463.1 amidohydrolase [Winogradskyella immobilis]
MKPFYIFLFLGVSLSFAQNKIEKDIIDIEDKVIEWRRHFHQNPELSNREFKTAEKIAAHLKSLGMEVQTVIAHTGVVGILKGDNPGKVLALRADIDALPVTERTDVPFKSTVTSTFRDTEVGVMHACGHDTHIAILMGVAEIMANNTDKIKGTIKFIFQPAEEGAPPGEEGGAKLMVKEGVLKNPDVDAIFGLHISAGNDVGTISYKPAGIMAAVNSFEINVTGKQSHGSTPWTSVDPIMASVKIIDGLQTIISRESPLTKEAAVLSIGKFTSGVRSNIIPESAQIIGTLRTLDYDMQAQIHKRMKEMIPTLAKAYRAEAVVDIDEGYPITYNDPDLTAQMLPSFEKVAGKDNVILMKAITGAEDFSFFQKEIPGVYFFLGGKPVNTPRSEAAPHHTPDFFIDESGILLGVKTFIQMSFDYLNY